jgi:two-component system chemotaxis response regulator CheB
VSLPLPLPQADLPRVLIVDDSVVARAALSRFVMDCGRYAVAAAVPDVARALAFLAQERVDVIVLDLEMPHTNGIDAMPLMLAAGDGARILVVSGSASEGAAVTIRALALGAADTLVKPAAGALAGRFGEQLVARLDQLFVSEPAPERTTRGAGFPLGSFEAIAIGASTGGIHALASLLTAVPATVTTPILVTQHLPPSFSPFFAAQVGVSSRRRCHVASDRRRIVPGEVMVAPGDAHLVAVSIGEGRTAARLSREPTTTGNLPSVDPMFASLAAIHGPRLLAIVLSGMGRDGLEGARAVREAGGMVVAQDEESSVVWGMPGAVVGAGLASAILPPTAIGDLIAAASLAA